MTSRSNAETVEKIGRAPERRRGKEQARGALLLTGPRRHRSPLGPLRTERAAGPLAQSGATARGRRLGARLAFLAPGLRPSLQSRVLRGLRSAPKAAGCMSPPRTCSRALPSAMPSTMRQKPRGQIQASTSPGLTRVSRPLLLLPCAGENVPIQEKDEGLTGQAAPATPARSRPANCHQTPQEHE